MLRRDIALGDREKTGEPRLGSQEIVTVLIENAFVDEISDRQQLPVGIEQKAELRCKRHRPRLACENGQPFPRDVGRLCGLGDILAMGVDRTQDRARPKQRIRARRIAPFDRDRAGDIDHNCGLGAKTGKLRLTVDFRKRGLLQSR